MTDIRTSFVILEDASSGAGAPLHKALAGDASSGKNAHGAFIAVDVAGNFQYAKVNASGELVVSTDSVEKACLMNFAANDAGSATYVTLGSISLINNYKYDEIGFVVSCTRDSKWQLIWSDNGVENILAEMATGAGDETIAETVKCLKFVAGATGTQLLYIKGKNLNTTSRLTATVTAEETQP